MLLGENREHIRGIERAWERIIRKRFIVLLNRTVKVEFRENSI